MDNAYTPLLCVVSAFSFGAKATTVRYVIAATKPLKRLVLWSNAGIVRRRHTMVNALSKVVDAKFIFLI